MSVPLFSDGLTPLAEIDKNATDVHADNDALAQALRDYAVKDAEEDVAALARFVDEHPQSAWRFSLLLNLEVIWPICFYME